MKNFILLIGIALLSLNLQAQNNCLEFDGTNDYAQTTLSSIPAGGNTYTVECWFYLNEQKAAYQNLVSQWTAANSGNSFFLGFNGYNSIDNLRFSDDWNDIDIGTWETNQWHHIAAVSTADNAYIYFDGILKATRGSALSYTGTAPVVMGRQGELNAEYLGGKIDEIRIWNDIRTETEIRQNMYRELTDPSGEANLVAYYKLNETSGTTADDAKGSNNGTLTNYGSQSDYWQTSPAMFGPKNCLEFDGIDDWISTSAIMPSAYTKEAWVYIPSENDKDNNIVSGNPGQHAFWISRGYSYHLSAGHNGVWDAVKDPNKIPFGTWQHIAVTYASGTMTLYRNGVQVDQANGVAAFTGGTAVRIGSYGVQSNLLEGKLDEVRIWNTARTASQIRDNMCRTLTGNESGLVAYYNFDNTSGTVLQDFSGNGYNGALQNMDNSDWVASSAFNTWLNTSSSSWATASNWSRASTPVSSDNVGIYSYSGGTNAALSGSPSVNHFVLGSSSALTLSSGTTVNGNLILESDLDLNGQTISLGTSAYLIEDEGRLYGSSGQIQTTRNLSNIDENVAGLGTEITTSANMGSTTITRSHAANSSPASIERRYNIAPTNNSGLNATLVFHYDNDELDGLTASALELYKSTDGGTNWADMNGSVNTFHNTITLSGIDGFSLWTAMESEDVNPPILETENPVHAYAQNSAAIILAPIATVTTANNIDNATVSISPIVSGDILSVSNLPDGLSSSWDNSTKILSISGTESASDYQTALRNVKFETSSAAEDTRTIDFILGDGVGLSIDGEQHFYEVMNASGSISWTNARSAALARRYGAAQGYLATITSSTENNYLAEKVTANTWIGANDSKEEDTWKWIDGPEADEIFWIGDAGGSAVNGRYENWYTGEPNDVGSGEDYAHMYGSNSGYAGVWNDLDNTNPSVQYYIVEYGGDGSEFTTIDYATVVVNGLSWTGSEDSDWATPGNWNNNSVPGSTDDISIPATAHDPVISSGTGANCKNLSVSPDASLTVNAGGSLITSGNVSGSVDVKMNITSGQWHFISAPVAGIQSGMFAGNYLQLYSESLHQWEDITVLDHDLSAVHGFSLWYNAGGKGPGTSFTFSGTPFTGTQNYELSFTEYSSSGDANEGANLVGNPYPSYLDWDEVNGYGTKYTWNGADYDERTEAGTGDGSQYVAPTEGFFVVTGSSGNTFTLTNDMRTHNSAKKEATALSNEIVLSANSQNYSDALYIVFNESANENFELPRDAWKFISGTTGICQIWSQCPDGNLAVDVRPETESIQLGFANNEAGTYSIGIQEIADISTAILEDTKLNIFHDLSEGAYSFDWRLNDDETRFKLHLNTTAVQEINGSAVQAYVAGGNIIIQSDQQPQRITLTDITGRTLGVWEHTETILAPKTAGVYLVTLASGNQMLTKKIIIE